MISCPRSLVREIIKIRYCKTSGSPAKLHVFPAFVFVKQKPEVFTGWFFLETWDIFIFVLWLFSERKELRISVSTESFLVFVEHDEHEV